MPRKDSTPEGFKEMQLKYKKIANYVAQREGAITIAKFIESY